MCGQYSLISIFTTTTVLAKPTAIVCSQRTTFAARQVATKQPAVLSRECRSVQRNLSLDVRRQSRTYPFSPRNLYLQFSLRVVCSAVVPANRTLYGRRVETP